MRWRSVARTFHMTRNVLALSASAFIINDAKMPPCWSILYVNKTISLRLFADHVFRLVHNVTHNSYTATT